MYSTTQLPLARLSSSSGTEPAGGLETTLLQLIQNHNQSALALREQSEKAKKDAIKKATRVSDLFVDTVNSGVQVCFINQKRIELEIRALASTITRFIKQSDQWLAASHALNTAVKAVSLLNGKDGALVEEILKLAEEVDYRFCYVAREQNKVAHRAASLALDVSNEIGDFKNWMKTMEFDC